MDLKETGERVERMKKLDIDKILELNSNQLSVNLPYLTSKLVIYGTGTTGEYLVRACRSKQIEPIVCDTYKVGQKFMGIEVKDFEEVIKEDSTVQVVIASLNYYEEIKTYLSKFINEEKIHKPVVKDLFPQVYFPWHDFRDVLDEYRDEIIDIFNRLADDKSREVMENYILGHYTGNNDFFVRDYVEGQYFNKELVTLSEDEVVIDGGAHVGDTLIDFVKTTGNRYKHYYAFEPTKESIQILNTVKSKELKNDNRIIVHNYALSDANKRLCFDVVYENMASNKVSEESRAGELVQAVKIDEVVNDAVSFIKMDIEGSEVAALKGAEQTILKYKPKLAICIYHKYDDILTIPSYIMGLGLDYRYYIRHHAQNANEYVFYAI